MYPSYLIELQIFFGRRPVIVPRIICCRFILFSIEHRIVTKLKTEQRENVEFCFKIGTKIRLKHVFNITKKITGPLVCLPRTRYGLGGDDPRMVGKTTTFEGRPTEPPSVFRKRSKTVLIDVGAGAGAKTRDEIFLP